MRLRQDLVRCLFSVLILGHPLPASAVGDGSYESVAHSVSEFNGTGECDCTKDGDNCADENWFHTYATVFTSEMDQMGYAQTEYWQNTAVDPQDFVDPARSQSYTYGADGTDPYGTDFADVTFWASHGNHDCIDDYRSALGMGEFHDGQPCWPETDDHIRWGDVDTNVGILFGCESTQLCVWEHGGYAPMQSGDFDILLGFHGTVWLDTWTQFDFEDYMDDSWYNNVGEYWVDYLTDIQTVPGTNPDQCATAVMWGSSAAEMDEAYDHTGYLDFHDTGAHTYTAFYYWEGCDPHAGEAL